jgi:DNA polymerase (family 10)
LAEEIVAALQDVKGVRRIQYAGSLRRMAETIGDVDVLVASENSGPIMEAFVALPLVAKIIGSGETKTSVRTTRGLQVDLRVVPPGAWGAALVYFTGSKAHNIRIREIAVRKKLKLSEYGLFRVDDDELLVAETEEEVYERLGMRGSRRRCGGPRRSGRARARIPDLIQLQDLRGDLHTHTNLTDGLATLEQMIETARARKYAYYAVTDHAPNLYMQRMTDAKMLAQRKHLAKLAAKEKMTLLHGTELNIDPDGGVDWGRVPLGST